MAHLVRLRSCFWAWDALGCMRVWVNRAEGTAGMLAVTLTIGQITEDGALQVLRILQIPVDNFGLTTPTSEYTRNTNRHSAHLWQTSLNTPH